MTHNFDIDVAVKYGINEAILLNNIFHWVEHNRANETNYYDGHYWTWNSVKAFSELFPYMTAKQIRYALKKLEKEGLIITGNYNQSTYDRTAWYTLTDDGFAICQKGQMDLPKKENGFAQKGKSNCQKGQMELPKGTNGIAKKDKPIPYNKPDSKPYNKPDDIQCVCNDVVEEQEDTHTPKQTGEKIYNDLCRKYGREFVDVRVSRGQQYNGITWAKISNWCMMDWKREHDSSRASPASNQFNNHQQQEYDMDELEKELLGNT